MAEKIEARFLQALGDISAPRQGDIEIIGAAKHGFNAGLDPYESCSLILETFSAGRCRVVTDRIVKNYNKTLAGR
ncbi:MAG TPA: hypothetical protein PLA74_10310 [Syntrophales bacterium]|nr:hypothetical protein [Syntrophales bacterium]